MPNAPSFFLYYLFLLSRIIFAPERRKQAAGAPPFCFFGLHVHVFQRGLGGWAPVGQVNPPCSGVHAERVAFGGAVRPAEVIVDVPGFETRKK